MFSGSRSPLRGWRGTAFRQPTHSWEGYPRGTTPARVPGPLRASERFRPTCASGRKSRQAALLLAAVALLLLIAAPAGAQQLPPPLPGTPNVTPNTVQDLPQFVDRALARAISGGAQARILDWGTQMARGIAVILIVWTGLRIAFSGAFHAWELIRFVFLIGLPLFMLNFYATSIPAVGLSFPELITEQGDVITRLFGADVLARGMQAVMALAHDHMQIVGEQADSISIWNAIRTGGKQVTHLALMTAILGSFVLGMIVVMALALAQIIFAKVAIAILVTLGPIFIPFMIVPKMDFLFWGWFKALIQYSLYGAIAAVMISLWTRIILGFARGLSAQDFTVQSLTTMVGLWAVPVFAVVVVAIVSILKIGDIAGMIAGAGSDGGGFIGGAFMAGRIVAAPARVAAAPLKGGLPA